MNYIKAMIVALLVLLAVVSFTVVAPRAADPNNHTHAIQQTEEKIKSVMTLSGGAAATSATLSCLPGDMCTPLAGELAELAKYFLMILSALYLEKFLITLSGYISFMFLIPIALVLTGLFVIIGKKNFLRTASKIFLIGMIIFCIVPASVTISDLVYQTQVEKVNDTIEEYNNLEIEGDTEGGFLNELTNITTGTIDKITDFTDNLLESLAVMIVTACVIPLLVFVFLVWLVKIIFSTNILEVDTSVLEALSDKILTS